MLEIRSVSDFRSYNIYTKIMRYIGLKPDLSIIFFSYTPYIFKSNFVQKTKFYGVKISTYSIIFTLKFQILKHWIYKHINYIPTCVIISMIFILATKLSHSKVLHIYIINNLPFFLHVILITMLIFYTHGTWYIKCV